MSPLVSVKKQLLGAFTVILGSIEQLRPRVAAVHEARWEMLGLYVP